MEHLLREEGRTRPCVGRPPLVPSPIVGPAPAGSS